MRKVMLDIETLGLRPGSVVLSIGAVAFDETGILEEFNEVHARLETDIQHSVGLRVEPGTALWWMDQPKDAQEELLAMPEVPAVVALVKFSEWLHSVSSETDEDTVMCKDIEIWCNGANFDGVLLREVYDALGVAVPWAWWNERCYRTERKSMQRVLESLCIPVQEPDFEETKHNALADARHQAKVLARYWSEINIG